MFTFGAPGRVVCRRGLGAPASYHNEHVPHARRIPRTLYRQRSQARGHTPLTSTYRSKQERSKVLQRRLPYFPFLRKRIHVLYRAGPMRGEERRPTDHNPCLLTSDNTSYRKAIFARRQERQEQSVTPVILRPSNRQFLPRLKNVSRDKEGRGSPFRHGRGDEHTTTHLPHRLRKRRQRAIPSGLIKRPQACQLSMYNVYERLSIRPKGPTRRYRYLIHNHVTYHGRPFEPSAKEMQRPSCPTSLCPR